MRVRECTRGHGLCNYMKTQLDAFGKLSAKALSVHLVATCERDSLAVQYMQRFTSNVKQRVAADGASSSATTHTL